MNPRIEAEHRKSRGLLACWLSCVRELAGSPRAADEPERVRLAFARLALSSARVLEAGSTAPERIEVLTLALVNARAAVRCLSSSPNTDGKSQQALGATPGDQDLGRGSGVLRAELEQLLTRAQSELRNLERMKRPNAGHRARLWLKALAPPVALIVLFSSAFHLAFGAREISRGKAWTTSTVGLVCDPAHRSCGGADTGILFHTEQEKEPWFQLDLGKEFEVERVAIDNRDDCCEERAVPLVVELASIPSNYRAVAHKYTPFDHWEASFAPTRARYVRVRVTRTSILHLDRVRVFGHAVD